MPEKYQVNSRVSKTTCTFPRLVIEIQKESDKNRLDYEITLFTEIPREDKFFNIKELCEKESLKKKWHIELLIEDIIRKIYKNKKELDVE